MAETNITPELYNLWLKYNKYANILSEALGRTSNIVGEFAEQLAIKAYNGKLPKANTNTIDFEADEYTYQVKSRKIKNTSTTQLNVIRDWGFNYLIVIIFNQDGEVIKGLECPVLAAKEYAHKSEHQRGDVITTSKKFLSDNRFIDITEKLKAHIS